MTGLLAYNPDDPIQAAFLATLAQGETGGSSYATSEGTGGANLSGLPTDQYGFPQWQGMGNSHAAGTYQFQPGTWSSIASQYGLNFQNPSDQSAGAWYLAEQVYQQQTGGNLESDLQAGKYSSVQNALASTWTSVTGNAAAPQGLAAALASKISSLGNIVVGSAGTPASAGNAGTPASGLSALPLVGGAIGAVQGYFVRGGLIIVGSIVIIVALWMLLASQDVVPSPREAIKSVAEV